jgi:hypothetical protein
MRIAYLSADEVNRDLVTRWADARDITLELLDLGLIPDGMSVDALLCDLDHLLVPRPPEHLTVLLPRVSCLVVVHGYNLDDQQAQTLLDGGVLVVRALTEDFLDRLYRAARALAWPPVSRLPLGSNQSNSHVQSGSRQVPCP